MKDEFLIPKPSFPFWDKDIQNIFDQNKIKTFHLSIDDGGVEEEHYVSYIEYYAEQFVSEFFKLKYNLKQKKMKINMYPEYFDTRYVLIDRLHYIHIHEPEIIQFFDGIRDDIMSNLNKYKSYIQKYLNKRNHLIVAFHCDIHGQKRY